MPGRNIVKREINPRWGKRFGREQLALLNDSLILGEMIWGEERRSVLSIGICVNIPSTADFKTPK